MSDPGSEHLLVVRLRAGDETAFVELVDRYHTRLVRLAKVYVTRNEIAEDIAQETWLAVLRGIDRFEERSSLQSWLFQICVNRARSAGVSEHRTVPDDRVDVAVESEQFTASGAWVSPPIPWSDQVESDQDDARLVAAVHVAVRRLPAGQQAVVTMRDLEGLSSAEVCQVLSITEANQRVLLHRGRAQVRAAIRAVAAGR